MLREFYPAILQAFADKRGGLLRPEARALLASAPTPHAAARLTLSQLRALLRRAGLRRGLDAEAARLQQVLRGDYLHHSSLVEEAFGRQALALLRQLDVACANAEDLAAATAQRFVEHPDAAIITSMPGLAELTGARILAEIGDDRARFADARGLKAYAGSAPVTRASGKTTAVLHRRVKNQRLASVGYVWAFAALTASPGARAHYDAAKPPGSGTSPHNATSSTDCWAACTTACTPARPTTKPPPSLRLQTPPKPAPLDKITAWDVFITSRVRIPSAPLQPAGS
jgi:transposase